MRQAFSERLELLRLPCAGRTDRQVIVCNLTPDRTQPVIYVSFQLLVVEVVEVLFDRLHIPSQFRAQVFNSHAGSFRKTYSRAAGLTAAQMPGGPQQLGWSQLVGDEELELVGVQVFAHVFAFTVWLIRAEGFLPVKDVNSRAIFSRPE
jgi:hypothetical protein